MLQEFHWLRPFWLLAMLPLVLLCWLLWQQRKSTSGWSYWIAERWQSLLLSSGVSKHSRLAFIGLGLAWIFACLALAGPSWQRLPQAVFQAGKPLVLVADLSPSMAATDIAPSRLARLRYKLTDIIKARSDGVTALVVYAGDAHVLAPLSDDSKTLLALLPGLDPKVMPLLGSNVEEAVQLASSLLKQAGFASGEILLLTDGVTRTAAEQLSTQLADSPYPLSILGIGSAEGAPIPTEQGFVKDAQGNIVLAKLEGQRLANLAANTGGSYRQMSLDNGDIQALLKRLEGSAEQSQSVERDYDDWQDAGPWLVLLLLPVAALAFRRGWLLVWLLVPMITSWPTPSYALEWQDLWQTRDQRAQQAFAEGDHATASELFDNPDWRASALYRQGQYQQAAELFGQQQTASGYYNQGNALAKAGELEKAVQAYDSALDLQPELADAKANRQLVKQLLEQQQQQPDQENSQQGDSQQGDPQQGDSQQSDSQQGDSQQGDSQQGDSQQGESQQGESQQGESQQGESQQGESQQGESQQGDSQQGDSQQEESQQEESQQEESQQGDSQQGASQQGNSQQGESQQGESQQGLTEQQTQALAEQLEQQLQQAGQSEQSQGNSAVASSDLPTEQSEQQQQLERWLGQLPEDPSGLLRNKFRYELEKKRRAYQRGQWQPNKEQRW